ncbi:hypothetical protein GTS_03800 [Gandjariella thermophila]|uniref:Uncharacterized protein n=2 Tax=Gandjariella thermophila TaxID=1931992 RepID=A0A4D4J439_9PSEU|nr:hypothetical protein GTS_03800 [Gandjariella thermophila]
MSRQQWREHYTRVCAEDFLPRVGALPGRWVVSVYRLPSGGERQFVTAVAVDWPPKSAGSRKRDGSSGRAGAST